MALRSISYSFDTKYWSRKAQIRMVTLDIVHGDV